MIDLLGFLGTFCTTWNTAFEAYPASSSSPGNGDDALRETRSETRQRMDQEHVWLDTASAGATIHREGSARSYYQPTAPTLRPDGLTALDTNDDGRIWVDSDTNLMYVWTGAAWSAGFTAANGVTNQYPVTPASEVRFKTFTSSTWNMDTTASIDVILDRAYIATEFMGAMVNIVSNAGDSYPLTEVGSATCDGSYYYTLASYTMTLQRVTSGTFDAAGFNAATAYVTIWYKV